MKIYKKIIIYGIFSILIVSAVIFYQREKSKFYQNNHIYPTLTSIPTLSPIPLFTTEITKDKCFSSNGSQTIGDLQNKIQDLQNKVSELGGQGKTLSSQISVMDSQICLTSLIIQVTEKDIQNLNSNNTPEIQIKKKQLEDNLVIYKRSLVKEKTNKETLLRDTQYSNAIYQDLLKKAQYQKTQHDLYYKLSVTPY